MRRCSLTLCFSVARLNLPLERNSARMCPCSIMGSSRSQYLATLYSPFKTTTVRFLSAIYDSFLLVKLFDESPSDSFARERWDQLRFRNRDCWEIEEDTHRLVR